MKLFFNFDFNFDPYDHFNKSTRLQQIFIMPMLFMSYEKMNWHFWNVFFSKTIQKIISDSIVNFDHTIIMKKKIPIFSSIQTTHFKLSPKFNFPLMSPTDFLSGRYLRLVYKPCQCNFCLRGLSYIDTWRTLKIENFLKCVKAMVFVDENF